MKKIWGLGGLVLAAGVGLTQFACSAGSRDEGTGVLGGDSKMDDLIGSVPVNSKSLDGIGSIGLVYDYNYPGGWGGATGFSEAAGGSSAAGKPNAAGAFSAAGSGSGGSQFYPQCTGTLISKNSVLTSRSCGQLLQQVQPGYSSLEFAIGADSTQSTRRIDVVDVEYAPAVSTTAGAYYPDIAVFHLGESISDVAPFKTAVLTDELIGNPLAGVGFGNSDLAYQSGTRRAGSLVLRGTSGLLYPLIFGSFEAFYQYILGVGYYPGPFPGVGGGVGVFSGEAGAPSGSAGAFASGGAFPMPPSSGGSSNGGSGPGIAGAPSAGSGGGDDWYLQYLQQQYDTTELAPGEAYLGGTDSDAQPCGADRGGPLVRKLQGQVRVFGVFSRTPFGSCEKGGLYASMTAETKAFVDAAAQWKDPCTDLTVSGKCVGNTATRCSSASEGKRRAVRFDCSLLNQVCVSDGLTEVACTDN
ncbi:MAG TPA: trypsin-like serine protease [Polyangiaceae bacterium]|nr:trypsin-like serine protease [Polyangiaceae bacterium]